MTNETCADDTEDADYTNIEDATKATYTPMSDNADELSACDGDLQLPVRGC